MSVSLQRNEITLLDGYNLNPKRDSKQPLIQQLTKDLLDNGFEDVGPQITKITISDEAIAKFVDEFIVWHYDSSLLSASEGAFGVADMISDPATLGDRAAGLAYTTFKLDGQFSRRNKEIDNVYLFEDWNKHISADEDHSNGGTGYTGGLDVKTALGPNAELFSYLNPHPDMRGGSSRWKTPVLATEAHMAQTVVHVDTTELLTIGEKLLFNDGVDVESSDITIIAINSKTSMTLSSAVTAAKGVRLEFGTSVALSTSDRPSTLYTGHFFKKRPPAAALEDSDSGEPQKGYLGLPAISKKVYDNEFNKIKRLITTSARGVNFMPDEASGISSKASLRHYKEELRPDGERKHHFWVSNYKDEFFFPAGVEQPAKFEGELYVGMTAQYLGTTFQVGDVYTFSFVHSGVSPAPDVTYNIDVTVGVTGSVQNFTQNIYDKLIKTNIADPLGGLFDVKIDTDRIGVIEITSRELGHNLTCTVSRAERTVTSYTNTVSEFVVQNSTESSTVTEGSNTATAATYINGYVHESQIRGIEGANIGDSFSITLKDVVDEDAADVLQSTAVKDVTVNFSTLVGLTSGELTEQLAAKMNMNSYIKKYMTVTAGSNYLVIKYNRSSSAYMKKGDVGAAHGLLASNTTLSGSSATIGATSSDEYTLNGFLVADLPSHAQFQVALTTGAGAPTNFYTASDLITNSSTYYSDFSTRGSTVADTDPLDFSLVTLVSGISTEVSNVRIQFPLARDLGTFANPPTGNYLVSHNFKVATKTPTIDSATQSGATNYFASYANLVLSQNERPLGPQISFDSDSIHTHPNTQFSGASNGMTHWSEFALFTRELEIESFEYVSDHTMGPIVLETSQNSTLSGTSGDQPWRIRLDVSRGSEILETSPYINEQVLEVQQDPRAVLNRKSYEYLNVHVATELQLKSNGDIAQIQGKDGIKAAKLREPGYLGAIRPQFNGYLESSSHLVNPYVNRESLNETLRTGFNIYAGIVGSQHYSKDYVVKSPNKKISLSEVFTADATLSPVTIPDGTASGLTIPDGVLNNDEYRYEEKLLRGSSTELLNDSPYNTGNLRTQKGFFRRTGKFEEGVAEQYPMTYVLTIADHGITFYVKDQASTDQADDNAFFVIQRHVDATTGAPDFTSEHQPVHCVYQSSLPPVLYSDLMPFFTSKNTDRPNSLALEGLYDISGNYTYQFRIDELKDEELEALEMDVQGRFRRFVVREKDTLKPWDRHVFAGINERDSHAVLNPLEQLTLNDAGQLVIQFPNRIGTHRFLYTGTELDLVAFCGAGAVGQDTLISSDRFSTSGTTDKRRLYKGMMSTEAYGNGMRILQLVGGHGINSTDVDTSLLTS